ncbi:replication-relaxation family protein [Streptomyces sp. NPDC127038]|uniref:replication-relaxation family protein n=1 Tax=Streptomyces sp. NPDC127038 TaxID=3347114 RepID=UPI0036526536
MTAVSTRDGSFVPAVREALPQQIVAALAQHRMATTAQLGALLRPNATRQAVSKPVNRLRREGLVDFVTLPDTQSRAWYLTPDGARVSRDWPHLRGRPPYPVTSGSAASMKTAHTLTAVRAHLAFAADARRRGDEHDYLDWTPEVSHPLGDSERLIADALMHYVRHGPDGRRTKLRALVEVDRATSSSERLARKLIDYARLHTYAPVVGRRPAAGFAGPLWLRAYPVFPRILFVLTGAGAVTLANRIEDLQAMAAEHPLVAAFARTVPLGAAVLEEMEERGPAAAVWTPLNGRGDRRPWIDL